MTGCELESHWPGIGGPFFDKNLEYALRQPKAPQRDPRHAKGIRMDAKESQMDSKGSQMGPKVAQGKPKAPPKGSQGDNLYIHKLPINRPSGLYVICVAMMPYKYGQPTPAAM